MRNIHIISHTHWDREWYRPYQYFRIKLVYVIDKMLDILENDPDFDHFLLDGQTVVLEDYLQVKPENAGRLKTMVEAGRVSVGPWYIQPDEFALDFTLDEKEREVIVQALEKTRYNKTAAAKLLGISFRALRYRIKKLGIE